MVHSRSSYMESIISVLSCTSGEFWSIYEGPSNTDDLAKQVMTNVIRNCEQSLRTEHGRYQLDNLLYAMLTEAPHPEGRRYVAVALQIAYTKGEAAVVGLAKAWMENLFLPMLAVSSLIKTEPSDSFQNPGTVDNTIRLIQPVTPTSDFGVQVAKREQHRCAVMKVIDKVYYTSLFWRGIIAEIPRIPQGILHTAPIIPFMFNALQDRDSISQSELYSRDFFQSWTQLDQRDLTEEKVNSPTNGILLSHTEYLEFSSFKLYFDKEAYPQSPNKYKVGMVDDQAWLSNTTRSVDVEFPTFAESGVEPPDHTFLKVHASFAKVLHLSGAAEYYDGLEPDSDTQTCLDTEDGSALLTYKLSVLAM